MDLRVITQAPALKIIFFVHLIAIVWGTQTQWLPLSYTTYNFLFLITLLWSLHSRDSEDAVLMATLINLISILLDAVTLGIYYGHTSNSSFSVFMVIVNLLLRPLTSLILLRFYNERTGRYSSIGLPGFVTGLTSGRSSYEDIDHRHRQTVPETVIDNTAPFTDRPPNSPPN